MRHANISSEYLPTMTASMNKHVCENHSTTNNTNNTGTKLVAALQMPKLELQVFDGNPLQFWLFTRLFETSVQCHADDVGKLAHLVQ